MDALPTLFTSAYAYSGSLVSLAMRFPEAAKMGYRGYSRVYEYWSGLSPRAKEKVAKGVGIVKDGVVYGVRTGQDIYRTAMAYPTTPADEWEQPPHWVLVPLSKLILTVLPTVTVWDASLCDDVDSMSPLPSSVEDVISDLITTSPTEQSPLRIYLTPRPPTPLLPLTLPLLNATIYAHTGALPRFALPSAHFSIPLWKHLLQSLGGVTLDQLHDGTVLKAGYSIVIFGDESEKATMLTDVTTTALHESYILIPTSTLPFPTTSLNIPLNPLQRLTNTAKSLIPAPLVSVLPGFITKLSEGEGGGVRVRYPVGWERWYVKFGPGITLPPHVATQMREETLALKTLSLDGDDTMRVKQLRSLQVQRDALRAREVLADVFGRVGDGEREMRAVREADGDRKVLSRVYRGWEWVRGGGTAAGKADETVVGKEVAGDVIPPLPPYEARPTIEQPTGDSRAESHQQEQQAQPQSLLPSPPPTPRPSTITSSPVTSPPPPSTTTTAASTLFTIPPPVPTQSVLSDTDSDIEWFSCADDSDIDI